MSKKDKCDLPPPLTRKSSRAEMWENIEAMGREIDSQQIEINTLTHTLRTKEGELTALRQKLATAYMRLNVIQAALSHPEGA